MLKRLAILTLLILSAACVLAQGSHPKPTLELVSKGKFGALQPGVVVAKVTFAAGLHGYQNPPSEDYMIPVKVNLAPGSTFKLDKVDYPKGEMIPVGGSATAVAVYGGTIEIPLHLTAPAAKGKNDLKVAVEYQQCSDKACFQPDSITASTSIEVGDKAEPTTEIVASSGSETTEIAGEVESKSPKASGLAGFIQGAFAQHNYLLIVPLLMVAGLVINLTPCVYPMVPVTISFFANQSAGNRAAKLQLGILYMLGIAATYGALGGVAAALGGTFGALCENKWVLIALGLMMVGLALSMFDLYQIGIPAPIARQLKGRSGPVGALIMGALVGVSAAPCAGPLVIAILAEIAKLKSVPLGITLFTVVGLGLGLPYMILSAVSTGAKALPKAGGWMKVVKSLLGLLVIGLGVNYFLQAFSRDLGPNGTTMAWMVYYGASIAYLLFIEKDANTRFSFGVKGVALMVFAWLAATGSTGLRGEAAEKIAWVPFTKESYEAAKKSGKPIVIDASANWCALCHEIEERVFDKPEVVAAAKNWATLRIDWSTGVDPAYKAETAKQFGIAGLPFFAIQKPGGVSSISRNGFETPKDLLDLVEKAK